MIELQQQQQHFILRLNHGVTNPINLDLIQKINDALDEVCSTEPKPGDGLVLAGTEKFFSIGFNVPELVEFNEAEFSYFWEEFNQLFFRLYTLPIPTVSAISGHAIAGGAVLAITTDYRVGSEGKKRIGLNEIELGIPIPYATDLVLRQLVGDRVANHIIYSGNFFNMETMVEGGLIDHIAPTEQVEEQAQQLIETLTTHTGPAFTAVKQNRTESIQLAYEKAKDRKNSEFMAMWFSEPVREKLREAAKTF